MIKLIYLGLNFGNNDLEIFMKTKFMKDTASISRSAFSLFELAIVLVVMGLIAVISARAIPNLNMQNKAIELGAELRNYTESILGRAEAERYFLRPDNFTEVLADGTTRSGLPKYSSYADSTGNRWGYVVTRDMTTEKGLCALDPAQKIGIIYCKGTLDACNGVSQVDSFVEDVAFLMFSSDAAFKSRVRFVTGYVPLNETNYSLTLSRAVLLTTLLDNSSFSNSSNNAIIMKIAAPSMTDPVDDTVMDFTYQEVWDKMGCPPLKSVTEGDVLSVRGASYQQVDMIYDFVPIPLNFLDTPGAEYCFESYEMVTTDFGLAQTYERDEWERRGGVYREESRYRYGDTGSGNGGSVDASEFMTNSTNSNYCNRGNNRMPTVSTCSGVRMISGWPEDDRTSASRSQWFPKWHKDDMSGVFALDGYGNKVSVTSSVNTPYDANVGYGYRKWFLCGGNGAYNTVRPGGRWATQDYQIRLRPGYRGTSDYSNYSRINNRTFKAYARIPGSRALYKQAFTMTVRGTTHFWYYDWPVD
jgi:competence protein ComGC